jgi:hypothetical protein
MAPFKRSNNAVPNETPSRLRTGTAGFALLRIVRSGEASQES